MRVYQFMPAQHALDDLRKRRLKVSFLEDMNDPFELLGSSLPRAEHRRAFRQWKEHMNRICRVLCFSRRWHNPVLWSHYADKHRGCCLGFDVLNQLLLPMSYEAKRLELQLERQLLQQGTVGDEISRKLMTTKFADWKYEDEVRMFVRLSEVHEELGLHFYNFSEDLALSEVVLGPRTSISVKEAKASVHAADASVKVITSRLAFRTFRVIETPTKGTARP